MAADREGEGIGNLARRRGRGSVSAREKVDPAISLEGRDAIASQQIDHKLAQIVRTVDVPILEVVDLFFADTVDPDGEEGTLAEAHKLDATVVVAEVVDVSSLFVHLEPRKG
jgi:hypothetical protein